MIVERQFVARTRLAELRPRTPKSRDSSGFQPILPVALENHPAQWPARATSPPLSTQPKVTLVSFFLLGLSTCCQSYVSQGTPLEHRHAWKECVAIKYWVNLGRISARDFYRTRRTRGGWLL